jgi:hypothetical protein
MAEDASGPKGIGEVLEHPESAEHEQNGSDGHDAVDGVSGDSGAGAPISRLRLAKDLGCGMRNGLHVRLPFFAGRRKVRFAALKPIRSGGEVGSVLTGLDALNFSGMPEISRSFLRSSPDVVIDVASNILQPDSRKK